MKGYQPLRDVHFVYDAWGAGWEHWADTDQEAADRAAQDMGSAWDDVFWLPDWDFRIAQVTEEGRPFFVRPTEDDEVRPSDGLV